MKKEIYWHSERTCSDLMKTIQREIQVTRAKQAVAIGALVMSKFAPFKDNGKMMCLLPERVIMHCISHAV